MNGEQFGAAVQEAVNKNQLTERELACLQAAQDIKDWVDQVWMELETRHQLECVSGTERCVIDMFGPAIARLAAQQVIGDEIAQASRFGQDAWHVVSVTGPDLMAEKIFYDLEAAVWEDYAAELSREVAERIRERWRKQLNAELGFEAVIFGTAPPERGRAFALSQMQGNAQARGLRVDPSTLVRTKTLRADGGSVWKAMAVPVNPRRRRRSRKVKVLARA